MKDLTHYFQSPASSAKKSTFNDEESGSNVDKARFVSVDDLPLAKPENNSKKKRKFLSLKRESENDKSKDKHSSEPKEDGNGIKSPEIDKFTDSRNPPKKRGRPKKTAVTSTDTEVENESNNTNIPQVSNCSRLSTNKTSSETCDKEVNNDETACEKKRLSCNEPASKNENKSVLKHKEQDESRNNTTNIASVSDVEMTDLATCSTMETNHTDFQKADIDTKSQSLNKSEKLEKVQKVQKNSSEEENVMKTKEIEKSSQDKNLSAKCLTESTNKAKNFKSESDSEEEMRVSKKLKLESEGTSPKDNIQTKCKLPNAFQVMVTGGSKKISIENINKDKNNDVTPKDTNSKQSKSSRKEKEETSKKSIKSKDGTPSIDKLNKNDTKNTKSGQENLTKTSIKITESPTISKKKEDIVKHDKHNKMNKDDTVKESSKSSPDPVQRKKSKGEEKKEPPKSDKIKKADNTEKSPDAFKLLMSSKKENICEEKEKKKSRRSKSKKKITIESDESDKNEEEELSMKPQEVPVKQNKADIDKKKDNLDTEKSPDALKQLMSSTKESKDKQEEEAKKPHRSKSKRRNTIESDDSEHEVQEVAVKQNKVDKVKEKYNLDPEKSPDVFKQLMSSKKESKDKQEDEKETKKTRHCKSKRKNIIESEDSEHEVEELSMKPQEVPVKQNKADIDKKKDNLDAEKNSDAFKQLMSSKKESKDKQEDICKEKDTKKSCHSKSKKSNTIESDESDENEVEKLTKHKEAPAKQKPSGLFGYFSPVSREEARKRANEILVTKTVTAEVHQEPKENSPDENRRHSLGPKRRSQQSKKETEEEIIVLSVEETQVEVPTKPKKPFKFKTPEKKKKRRPWLLKVRLLSPAKPMEDLSDSSGSNFSDTDSDIQEISPSPKKKQGDLKALWAARENTRIAPIFMSKSKNTSSKSTKEEFKSDRKIVSVAAMPLMRPAPTEHTIGFAEVDPATPMAVLFPSISHITQTEKTESNIDSTISFPPTPVKEVPVCPAISPGSLINTNKSHQEVLPASKVIEVNKDNKGKGESWCEKHKPITADNIAGNAKSVQRLKVWLEGWRQRSTISDDRSHKSSDSESSDYSSEDDFIVSDDDSNSDGRSKKKKKKKHCNTALLVGPCGSGKTASVYAVAEELGFKVLEMNASSRRSGKRILSELQEATQSHQVRNNAVDQDTVNTFFGSTSKGKDKVKNQVMESQQQGNNSGLSVILVEDVDVVFEEQDEGFLAALNVLAASSKRPLILVSNEPQCPLLLARQHRLHLEFNQVPSPVIGGVVKQICSTEGETLGDSQLQHLMKVCKGDLRRAVLFAQTWTLTGGFPQVPATEMLPFPLNLSILWSGLKHVPLPYILHEDDIIIEEENKEPEPESDSDHIFSPPKKKPKAKRLRLTSDSMDTWEPTQGTSCPDLKKMLYFSDMLATLDVMQGSQTRELNFSYTRPGLSDQPCHNAVSDRIGPILQHWLASKAVSSSGCKLVFNTSEQRDRWRKTHQAVDQSLLEQLPLIGQLDHHAAALDLLPALRDLGRSEQSSGRISRRSKINALNSLGFHPGGITVETLPFIFPNDLENS